MAWNVKCKAYNVGPVYVKVNLLPRLPLYFRNPATKLVIQVGDVGSNTDSTLATNQIVTIVCDTIGTDKFWLIR